MKTELISSGLTGLDEILTGMRLEDNVVWRVDDVESYAYFAQALASHALSEGRRVVYFRFGNHPPVLSDLENLITVNVDPEDGFENFISQIHHLIQENSTHLVYVFDCISNLDKTWYSDRMIGNFFKLTCPYLFKMKTLAYFALFRNQHSYHAIDPITQTTQILLDVYNYNSEYYIQPAKVTGRITDRISSLYRKSGDVFTLVSNSDLVSQVTASSPWQGLRSASYRLTGIWDRTFMNAEQMLDIRESGLYPESKYNEIYDQICRLLVSRDKPVLRIVKEYLSLSDLIYIWKRMIGTGMIGGKAVGMLLARSILKKKSPELTRHLESHDSFFIGSDVYYTYLVENGGWWDRQRQKDPDLFLNGNDRVQKLLLKGEFPEYILKRFSDLIDYFGTSPIIVRSSSLLEDNFGNAFAGKYESIFCPNQGSKEERFSRFLDAVRVVYASTMSNSALKYRKKRGVLEKDEQMALLVQRVSGQRYSRFFFPQLAGVSFSFNPFVWSRDIEAEAGMARIVFGLGTRAVERSDDDYTRVVALNAPEKRPESTSDDVSKYSQHRVDLLDLGDNRFCSMQMSDLLSSLPDELRDLFVTWIRPENPSGTGVQAAPVLSFSRLLNNTTLITNIRSMLEILRNVYEVHVDVEFTANFDSNGDYKINLVQCRPLQIETADPEPVKLTARQKSVIIETRGAVIGHSRHITIDNIVFISPHEYGKLDQQDRYKAAHLIGDIVHSPGFENKTNLLIGPGRWGTSSPSLGVPVTFSEIDTVSALCEIDAMHEGLIPDLSLGTHFFNEMVEMDMLYLAMFLEKSGNGFSEEFFTRDTNQFEQLFPGYEKWSDIIFVTTADEAGDTIRLFANALEQYSIVYMK